MRISEFIAADCGKYPGKRGLLWVIRGRFWHYGRYRPAQVMAAWRGLDIRFNLPGEPWRKIGCPPPDWGPRGDRGGVSSLGLENPGPTVISEKRGRMRHGPGTGSGHPLPLPWYRRRGPPDRSGDPVAHLLGRVVWEAHDVAGRRRLIGPGRWGCCRGQIGRPRIDP